MADEKLDPPVAVIGYGYWQRRFGGAARRGRPDHLVRGSRLHDRRRHAARVLGTPARPPGGPDAADHAGARHASPTPGDWWFEAVARLRPDATVEQATAAGRHDLPVVHEGPRPIGRDAGTKYFDHIELTPASRGLDRLRARFSRPLVRAHARGRQWCCSSRAPTSAACCSRAAPRVRASSRSGWRRAPARGRLLRQLLTETLVIFLLGAGAGLLVAHAGDPER